MESYPRLKLRGARQGLLAVRRKIPDGLSMFLLCRGPESALVVDKDDPGGLEKDQHIRLSISIDIRELERDRSLVRTGSKKLRPQVDARV